MKRKHMQVQTDRTKTQDVDFERLLEEFQTQSKDRNKRKKYKRKHKK